MSLKTSVYARVVTLHDGTEVVDFVSHEIFNAFDINSEGAAKTLPLDGVRIVEFEVDVPTGIVTKPEPADDEEDEWDTAGYRVEVRDNSGNTQLLSDRMTLQEAAKLVYQFAYVGDDVVFIRPPQWQEEEVEEKPKPEPKVTVTMVRPPEDWRPYSEYDSLRAKPGAPLTVISSATFDSETASRWMRTWNKLAIQVSARDRVWAVLDGSLSAVAATEPAEKAEEVAA